MDFLPDLLTVVEWATTIVAFVMMGSVIPLCLKMYRHKSTTNVPYIMFLISIFLTVMSLTYGTMVGSKMIILINIVGVCLWSTYIGVYILVSRSKTKPLLGLIGVAGLYFAHVYHLQSLPQIDQPATFGMYMLFWVLVISIIPAGEIFTIVREKSTNCCDLTMTLAGTLNAVVWGLYGYLVNDFYIYVPILPGLTVNFIKFCLMIVYGLPSHQPIVTEPTFKDGIHKDFDNSVSNSKAGETLRQRK